VGGSWISYARAERVALASLAARVTGMCVMFIGTDRTAVRTHLYRRKFLPLIDLFWSKPYRTVVL
jgi:hypothetical protein